MKEKNMIGKTLRTMRTFYGLSVTDLARKLVISKGFLSSVEHNNKAVTLELLNKYASIFQTKAHTILYFSELLKAHKEKENFMEETHTLARLFMQVFKP